MTLHEKQVANNLELELQNCEEADDLEQSANDDDVGLDPEIEAIDSYLIKKDGPQLRAVIDYNDPLNRMPAISDKLFYKEMSRIKEKSKNAGGGILPPKKSASAYIIFQKEVSSRYLSLYSAKQAKSLYRSRPCLILRGRQVSHLNFVLYSDKTGPLQEGGFRKRGALDRFLPQN